MLGEILVVAGASAVGYTILDYYNYLPWSKTADGSFKPWWQKPPFATPSTTTQLNQTQLLAELNGYRRVEALRAQQEAREKKLGTSKYVVTSQ